jgi:hypothetical protein
MGTVSKFGATLGDDGLGVLGIENLFLIEREDWLDADTCFDGLLLMKWLFGEGHPTNYSNNYSGK